jgi:hypothetical protein
MLHEREGRHMIMRRDMNDDKIAGRLMQRGVGNN